jgi:transposase InsO family protein
MKVKEIAEMMNVSPRTLQRWRVQGNTLIPRGRPPLHADRASRQEIITFFACTGPRVGLPTLRNRFPGVSRGELVEYQKRWRYAFRRRRKLLVHLCQWRRAGVVWAMDNTKPPAPIDGKYRELFMVRDLGSKKQLVAQPMPMVNAEVTEWKLEELAVRYGPPLVLKSDNDSIFKSSKVVTWADRHKVLMLYSPVGTPEYNGAIEAGIGSIKCRAFFPAARRGHPGEWTCDDIQEAVEEANHTARPFGLRGPTPEAVWNSKKPISEKERRRFQKAYNRHYERECRERGISDLSDVAAHQKESVDRIAIRRALVEEGYLVIRRRRITPPFRRWKSDRLS